MKKEQILTVQDLLDFEQRFKAHINEALDSHVVNQYPPEEEYLRTRDVKKLLKVSDNTLKSMRDSGSLPYTYINKTVYYSKTTIQKLLKDNMINNLKTK